MAPSWPTRSAIATTARSGSWRRRSRWSRVLSSTTGPAYSSCPFNTIYQLIAEAETQQAEVTDRVLLIPDLLGYLLTGVQSAEITNASTTQLLDLRTGRWALDLARRVGIPPAWLPPLRGPGELLGHVRRSVLADAGIAGPVPLFTVASHDTASAVVATPAADERFAYISCGTWSLVGVKLDCPVVTNDSLRLNFTNEVGIDGSVHFLRNVMGLWLLQECIKAWQMAGFRVDLESLIRDAAAEPPLRRSSIQTTRSSSRRATCRPGSPRSVGLPGNLSRTRRRRWSGRSSRVCPWRIGGRCVRRFRFPAGTSTRSISSAEVRGTSCCVSSQLMRALCRS